MTELHDRLAKARVEINALKNTASRALYALDKAIEVADAPVVPPVVVPPVVNAKPWDIAVVPKMTVSQNEVKPGETTVHLKFSLDRDPWMTVRLFAAIAWTAVGFDGKKMGQVVYSAVWNPGDDLDAYVSIPLSAPAKLGWSFKVVCGGALRQSGYDRAQGWEFDVTVSETPKAPNALPAKMPFHRPQMRLSLGKPTFDQGMKTIEWAAVPKAGSQKWRTTLQYGSGPANGNEVGLYTSAEQYPGTDAHSKEVDASGRPFVRLHSRKFGMEGGKDKLVQEVDLGGRPMANKYYPYQASWLSGQFVDGVCHPDGLWEFEAITPDRKGAWSAHWFMGMTSDGSRRTMWPPEIDGFEHFNGTYGEWDPVRETSTTLHYGPYDSSNRVGAHGSTVNLTRIGFPADIDLTKQIHKYQTLVDGDWIRTFVDGLEICTFRNVLKPTADKFKQLFHPVVNVAVATSGPYDQGSGDMLMYGYRYWPVADVRLI